LPYVIIKTSPGQASVSRSPTRFHIPLHTELCSINPATVAIYVQFEPMTFTYCLVRMINHIFGELTQCVFLQRYKLLSLLCYRPTTAYLQLSVSS
jgi:hypothetical protein